jgi:glycerol-3-phosphate dehydrogenase (NAD(P)+)
MPMQVAVIGAGSWGTTVAHLCAKNGPTTLWARRDDVAVDVRDHHRNSQYLEGFDLTPSLHATSSLEDAVRAADVLVMGVPSHGMRETAKELAGFLRPWVPVVSLSKGLEQGSRLRMTEVLEAELPGHPCGVLTGPNLAKEVLVGDAAATVVAMDDPVIAETLQDLFSNDLFRVYTNPDVIGCEIAGALKNVMAIASGMAEGLGTGDNTRSAVITRGLAELTRLGCAMGGQQITFAGLAGMGDLIATCISPQSRNRYVGEQLGRGRKIDEIIDEMHMVAEGVKTSKVVMELAHAYNVSMPIAREVHRVVHEGATAADAYRGLMGRPDARSEMHGMPDA